jgi:hypothetical protein
VMMRPSFFRVDELLRYGQETGKFYWKVHLCNRAMIGSEAGSLHKSTGYIYIGIDRKQYPAHQIAHLLMTGQWPGREPEHENQIKSDNRWENIKDFATDSQNGANRRLLRNSTSGLKGVTWDISHNKWKSSVRVMGKLIHLGYFTDLRLAGLTYDVAAKLAWGERFSCLNFSSEDSDSIVLSSSIIRHIGGLQ